MPEKNREDTQPKRGPEPAPPDRQEGDRGLPRGPKKGEDRDGLKRREEWFRRRTGV
jgi:hypothetical protein